MKVAHLFLFLGYKLIQSLTQKMDSPASCGRFESDYLFHWKEVTSIHDNYFASVSLSGNEFLAFYFFEKVRICVKQREFEVSFDFLF